MYQRFPISTVLRRQILETSGDPFVNLCSLSARMQSEISEFMCPPGRPTNLQVFFATLLCEGNRIGRAFCDKVALKRSAIDAAREHVTRTVRDALPRPTGKHLISLSAGLADCLFDPKVRVPLNERAYVASPLAGNKNVRFISAWANDDEQIPLSGGALQDWYVSIDLWARRDANQAYLLRKYVERLRRLITSGTHPDVVCLVEKKHGPKGFSAFRESLAKRAWTRCRIPVVEYSQETGRIRPLVPSELLGRRRLSVCIFSDIVVSGRNLEGTAIALSSSPRKWRVECAVVLGDYRGAESSAHLDFPVEKIIDDPRFVTRDSIRAHRGRRVSLPPVYDEDEMQGIKPPSSWDLGVSREQPDLLAEKTSDVLWWERRRDRIMPTKKGPWFGVLRKRVYEADTEELLIRYLSKSGERFSVITKR